MNNKERTDQQILDQTNKLAQQLYALRGHNVRDGYQFQNATHPHEVAAWEGACIAQELLTDTDILDVLSELEL